jgi:hypothetical protein
VISTLHFTLLGVFVSIPIQTLYSTLSFELLHQKYVFHGRFRADFSFQKHIHILYKRLGLSCHFRNKFYGYFRNNNFTGDLGTMPYNIWKSSLLSFSIIMYVTMATNAGDTVMSDLPYNLICTT